MRASDAVGDERSSRPRFERVLVLGASGLLGGALVRELTRRGMACFAPSRRELDLSSAESLPRALGAVEPDAVLNAAAFTDIARAEAPETRDEVMRVNLDAPRALAAFCREGGIPFVHFSTDYVFDGSKVAPYGEEDVPAPLQGYGKSKLDGERSVLDAHPRALVIRTSSLFGPGSHRRPVFVDTVLRLARQMHGVGLAETPVASPTYTLDLARASVDLLEAEAAGVVHVANGGACSRVVLARAILEEAGLSGMVEVRTEPDPSGGPPRPPFSALAVARAETLLGRPLRSWRAALAEYLEVPRP